MRSVGLKLLKNKLSEYVRIAAGGERVLVTDRDRVVAELVPPESGRAEHMSDVLLLDLVRKGLVTPAMNRTRPMPERSPRKKWKDIAADLERDRDDR